MKKLMLCVFALFLGCRAYSIQWEIIGQKSEEPVYQGFENVDLRKTLGEITVALLQKKEISFIGSAVGIKSIFGTPMGDDAIVIESPTRMRVYGWCYEVDGVQPSVMPDKFYFTDQKSKMRWFFAYTVYDQGNWIDFCTPAHKKPIRLF